MLVADRYQLDHVLGRGAMGEVWHAADLTLNRPVAVKLLQTGQATATDTERFRLEAQTAARLSHPNVVGVYDFGSHEGRYYLVMELISGRSLAEERRRRTVLDHREAAAIAAQTAAGLAAAHRQRVIHRDIKPGNVMVTADRTVKITDFGIARFADEATGTLTAAGQIIGSAAYLPPERALGRTAQPASDIYSLGCVLYELLTGRPPFTGATALALVQQHVDAVPIPPVRLRPDIPAPLADYVLLMLDKDPARRPTAEQAATRLLELDTPQERPGIPPQDQPTALLPPPAVPHPPAPPPAAPLASAAPGRAMPGRAMPSRAMPSRAMPPKMLLALACIAVLATAAAVSASLASDNTRPSTPPAVSTPASPDATPTSTQPPATTSSPAVEGQPGGPGDHDKHRDREGKRHKGKG